MRSRIANPAPGPARPGPTMLLGLALALACAVSAARGQSLDRALRDLLTHPSFDGATVGVAIRDLGTREWLLRHEADTALIPASNIKLVTAAAALEWLGASHTFYTRLGSRGDAQDGELHGDLVLEGNGDPWFGGTSAPEDNPATWATRLQEAGIRRVRGDLILVERTLDRDYAHPDWGRYEPASTVAREVAALGCGENVVAVTCRPGAGTGDPARLAVDPPCGHVTLVNRMVTVNGRSSGPGFGREPGSNRIEVRGRIARRGRPLRGGAAIHDPPLFLARVFQMSLRNAGIAGATTIRRDASVTPDEPRRVAEHRVTVGQLLPAVLGESDNRLAEILAKAAGAAYSGDVGSFATAARSAAAIMKRAGAAGPDAVYRDGSGLSRLNRLTARRIVELLDWVARRPYARAYSDALAHGGESGTTLRRRFAGEDIADCLRAKTGYLNGVRAISGYLRVSEDRALAFALIANGPTAKMRQAAAREAMDDFIRAVWKQTPAPRNPPGR